MNYLRTSDSEIAEMMNRELGRQREKIELIASENFTSSAVMEAIGSVLTNKYAEGYPGKRYYGGCEFVDQVEDLARERAKQLFDAEHANVQPHSGSQANMAVYFSVLNPGDTILGMDLSHGGHLTHGSPVNFSGKLYHVVSYGVDKETHRIDYNNVLEIAKQCKPKLIVAGASAYPRAIDFRRFREIADEVGAYLMVDMAHIAGLVAAGLHESPVPYAHFVTSTTHKTLRGPRSGMILCKAEFAKAIDKTIFPGMQGGPLENMVAAKAVCFKEAMQMEFKDYQAQVLKNAKAMADAFLEQGFNLVSGGTDNHLFLVDLRSKGVTGKLAEKALDEVGITVNKNTVPFETESPFVTSGIRIGTAAVSTRGMKEKEMQQITKMMTRLLENIDDEGIKAEIQEEVKALCERFPLYEGLAY